VSSDPGMYAPPFYGFIAPYSTYYWFPYNFTYPYGFGGGRFIPHSHFFPGARKQPARLYFPYGHASHRGFLFGHGFVLRLHVRELFADTNAVSHPWQYSYKIIKSIVQVEFLDEQPPAFWAAFVPREYDFQANVNPAVPYPRWSQANASLPLKSDDRNC